MPIPATVTEQINCGQGWQRVRIHIPNLIPPPQPGQSLIIAERQLPIMNSDNRGNIECLLPPNHANLATGAIELSGLGGQPFQIDPRYKYPLLLGQDLGMASMIFFSATLKRQTALRPLVLLGSSRGFPFRPQPSHILVPGLAPDILAAAPLLEDWKVASRLATTGEQPGCFEGTVIELATRWLSNLGAEERNQVTIYFSGDHSTHQAAVKLANDYRVSLQTTHDTSNDA